MRDSQAVLLVVKHSLLDVNFYIMRDSQVVLLVVKQNFA